MALYSITVMRNEADRYLKDMLFNLIDIVDRAYVYDDQSTDDSVAMAEHYGACVAVREESVPGFLQHEGQFRQGAWDAFENCFHPRSGDWVLAIDADEVMVTVGTNACVRCEMKQAIQAADAYGAQSIRLPVPEVFGFADDGTPLTRSDGWWGRISGMRLFRYQPGGRYKDKPMASGAEPTYVEAGIISPTCYGLHLMHFGYADRDDQIAKHARYTTMDAHGHSNDHVNSILGPPALTRWTGPIPEMRRGAHVDRAA